MHSFIIILKAIIYGLLLGFIISIPLGPSGIESVKRTISKGYKEGFTVALGALSADLTYLLIINCGLSNILSKNHVTESLFWIISGIILSIIGYISIVNEDSNLFNFMTSKNGKIISLPFLTGYVITLSNPMTPSLWLTLSGTVIRAWYYVNKICYYIFIFSIICGMICWFALLDYLALKGIGILNQSTTKKTSKILKFSIVFIGICFIIYGLFSIISVI